MSPRTDDPSSRRKTAQADQDRPESKSRTRTDDGRQVVSRNSQYLISARLLPGFPPIAFEQLEQYLKEAREVEIVKVLKLGSTTVFPSNGGQRVIVARMPDTSAQMLQQAAGPQLVIERDHSLTFHAEPVPFCTDPGVSVATTEQSTVTITVMGEGRPVAGARVYLFGSEWPSRGITGEDGRVELTLEGEAPENIRGLFIKPAADFWSFWLPNPAIDPAGENVVTLTSLRESIPNFPKGGFAGWGVRALRIDQLPPNFRGQGVKVAVIDSGVAATHDGLKRAVKGGIDLTSDDREGWKEDETGHGTLSAGIIAGNPEPAGVRGCAPDAELIVCKLYPEGRYSDLLQALEYCIEQQVDVICLNLAGPEPSELIEQSVLKAKLLGICCIVAAGDSATPVHGLAASPNVLTVSALGKMGEFPPNSYHAQTLGSRVTPEGFFSARFTCLGPQISLCGPGVAVISTAAPNNYAVADGSSVAAAHIAGLAALILAHHPDFQAQGLLQTRSPQRVERLFQIVKQTARLLDVGDISRTGLGLPDAVRAFGAESFPAFQPGFGVIPAVMSPLAAFATMGAVPPLGGLGGVPTGPLPTPISPAGPWPPARPAAMGGQPESSGEARRRRAG